MRLFPKPSGRTNDADAKFASGECGSFCAAASLSYAQRPRRIWLHAHVKGGFDAIRQLVCFLPIEYIQSVRWRGCSWAEVMAEKVLFVCLGNICRSPLAEAAFRQELKAIGLEAEADSAGIGDWHIGEAPDRRAQAVAKRNGIDISGYRARLVTLEDFRRFSYIVAMDRKNLAVLKAMRPADATAELSLLLDHVEGREGQPVADPYYGEEDGFDVTWADVTQGAKALVQRIVRG